MKKLVFTLALASLPAMSFASGIDLTWVDCIGGAPQTSVNFNCAANSNVNLQFQFKLPVPMGAFVAATAFVDYQNSSGTPLSSFWHYEAGSCQMLAATKGVGMFDALDASGGSCPNLLDVWGGDGTAGSEQIAAYGTDFHRPGNGYFILVDARPDAVPVTATPDNYWLFRLNFRTNNRAACPGCSDAGVILWQRLQMESNDGAPPVILDSPDKLTNCDQVNGGQVSLCGVVPAKNTTWGQLKSLYR